MLIVGLKLIVTLELELFIVPFSLLLNFLANDHNFESGKISETNFFNINIGIYLKDLGYLLDEDNNKEFDSFYNFTAEKISDVIKIEDDIYFIDTNSDSTFDYSYNYKKNELSLINSDNHINVLSYFLFPIIILLLFIPLKKYFINDKIVTYNNN